MILAGSYANGFAPRDGRPLYPELWRGCVGAWAPCLGPSGLTVRDWSGLANHATLTAEGTDWGSFGGRIALDFATDDYATIPNSTAYSVGASRTWSIWYRGTSDTNQVLWGFATTAANQPYFTIEIGSSTALLTDELISIVNEETGTAGTGCRIGYTTTTRTQLFDGNWHHIAVAAAGTEYQIWLDGISRTITVGRVPNNGTPTISSWNVSSIGASRRLSAYGFLTGQWNDARIYNRALSAKEITSLASEIGIAYKLAPRRRASSGIAFNRRRRLLVGAGT